MSKKSNSSAALTMLGILGGLVVAAVAGTAVLYRKNMKKMQQHQDENNMMYCVSMSKKNVEIKEDTNNAYFTCLAGKLNLNLSKLPGNKDVFIEVFNLFGSVNINVPYGVLVSYEGEDLGYPAQNVALESENEDAPVIHVKGRNILGKLKMRTVIRREL